MIKKYNITKPEKYTGKDGAEKTMWHQIGVLTEFHKQDGSISRIIEIPAIGLKANVFEKTDRAEDKAQYPVDRPAPEQRTAAAPKRQEMDTIEYPEEEINPEDIPF